MALTENYVSALAAGGGDGLSELGALTFTEMVTAINAGTKAGVRFNIKSDGVYSRTASDTISGSGAVGSPIILRGYKTTPGDGYLGRTNGSGPLIATNMPTVAYGVGCGVTLATHNIFVSLNFTGSINGILVSMTGNATVFCCAAINSASNASASCFARISGDALTLNNCDGTLSGATSAGYVFNGSNAGNVRIINCQAHNLASAGVGCYQASSSAVIDGCIAYASAGVGVNLTASPNTVTRCTIQGQEVAGIRTPNSAQSNQQVVTYCMITDCGRALLNQYNGTAAHPVFAAFNRFRDNTNPDLGFGDWPYFSSVTTDTGGPEMDYADAANGDLRLIATSPAKGAFFGADIGACQWPPPTLPAVGNVKAGITMTCDGPTQTGTRTDAPVDKVESGTTYGAGGTELTGTLIVPIPIVPPVPSDVRLGIPIGDGNYGDLDLITDGSQILVGNTQDHGLIVGEYVPVTDAPITLVIEDVGLEIT